MLYEVITDIAGSRSVEYQYQNNQLVKVIDPTGSTSTYTYNSQGLLDSIKEHNLNTIEAVDYYPVGNENQGKIRSVTDRLNHTKTYTYDNANKETAITDAYGKKRITKYDSSMYVTSVIDVEGKVTRTEYFLDSSGRNIV